MFWNFLGTAQTHVEWTGMPDLSGRRNPAMLYFFLVASRCLIRCAAVAARRNLQPHAAATLWRSVLLIFLGIFLRRLKAP